MMRESIIHALRAELERQVKADASAPLGEDKLFDCLECGWTKISDPLWFDVDALADAILDNLPASVRMEGEAAPFAPGKLTVTDGNFEVHDSGCPVLAYGNAKCTCGKAR